MCTRVRGRAQDALVDIRQADRVGFEPTRGCLYGISNPAQSARLCDLSKKPVGTSTRGFAGIEPALLTDHLDSPGPNRLAHIATLTGFEPATFSQTTRRSTIEPQSQMPVPCPPAQLETRSLTDGDPGEPPPPTLTGVQEPLRTTEPTAYGTLMRLNGCSSAN